LKSSPVFRLFGRIHKANRGSASTSELNVSRAQRSTISAFTRVFDALWVHRRSGIVQYSEFAKIPVQQRIISCCAAPGIRDGNHDVSLRAAAKQSRAARA
jgi:hypothetical protein